MNEVQSMSLISVLGSVGLLLGGWAVRTYLLPFLKVGKRAQFARLIVLLADDLVNELKAKYPDKVWLERLDEAIEKLAALCEIDLSVARRAILAASARQQ